jgi:predicted kinase
VSLSKGKNMPKLVVVMGLAGSGKTLHLPRLKAEHDAQFMQDSFMKDSHRHQKPIPCSRHYGNLIVNLRSGHNCVISDTVFCKEASRDELVSVLQLHAAGTEIIWFCFENNPEQCRKNVISSKREVNSRLQHIEEYIDKYTYPSGVTPIPVGDGSSPTPPPDDVEGLDL